MQFWIGTQIIFKEFLHFVFLFLYKEVMFLVSYKPKTEVSSAIENLNQLMKSIPCTCFSI